MNRIFGLFIVLCGLASAQAEPFPSKVLRIVVPFPISGPSDISGTARLSRSYKMIAQNAPPPLSDVLARITADAIKLDSRYPVMLERQPGGMTTQGAETVARATADGHTLLLASNGTMILNPNYFRGIGYDPRRDFVPVAALATMPFVLMAGAGVPAEAPRSLILWLKRRPGEINYGSSGEGSTGHLAGELFRRMAGVDIVHVSFNGGIAALNGLATRQVSVAFVALPLALAYRSSEYFRPLAVAGADRLGRLPAVPTLAESGLPGFEVEGWYGLFAPAGSPSAAIAWVEKRVNATFGEPATRMQLAALGLEPASASLGRFAARIDKESEQWAPVLRASRTASRAGAS